MTILLLRHAHAGDRARWEGDDRLRPLSEQGWRQAEGLIERYSDRPLDRVVSSPLVRCVQTVEPLAAARGLEVERDDALAEGVPLDVVTRLIARVGDDDAVLCTHGDVVELVLTDLAHRGIVDGETARLDKGGTWVLEGAPEVTRATFLPPPAS